ncbi:PBP1A family penicillin-binding protein [Candidatus Azambacteria bacterium]|nr:PBP1A family penicillin-binding protein [Candidatus Azambacteria bacterium]
MPRLKNYKYARKKKRGALKRVVLFSFVALAVAVFSGIFLVLATMKRLPDPLAISQLKISESTKIYDRTGSVLLYEIHGEEKRTVVPFDRMSRWIKDATIVAEDFNFYTHSGIDFKSIVRAFLVDVTRWDFAQGGSTITQQLVKNTFLTSERTLTRKIKEALLAIKIEKSYTKEEIFAFYLNQIPYGSNAYGVESAAQTFFEKGVSDLTLNEAAALAALPKAPSRYSPYGEHKDELITRRNYILDRMERVGFATPEEVKKAKGEPLVFARQKESIKAPHFVMYVKNYLEERYGVSFVENAGLKVFTTLDWDLQQKAEEVVARIGKENEKKYHAKNAAIVAVDPKTGQLLAMVGSRDYFDVAHDGNYNVATSKNRQPGSSFKPFAYAEFFKKGYPPETALFDAKTEFSANPEESYSPNNYDDKFRGPVSAKSALAQSLNVPSVKVLYLAGIDDVIRLAHDLGITTLQDRSRIGLSLVLGGGEVSPFDMAYAYGVFANEGVRNEKAFILKIQDAGGVIQEEWKRRKKEVLEKNVARTITAILSSNDLRAPIFGAHGPLSFDGFEVAAKTGTTQNYKDAWVVGYSPSLAAAVWVGNNDGAPMEKGGAGIAAAGPIFHEFMSGFLRGREVEHFSPPEPMASKKPVLNGNYIAETRVRIDKDSGKLATSKTPPEKAEEKTYKEIHTILQYVDKNNPLGDPRKTPSDDPQYDNWERGVSEWLNENKSFLVPYDAPPTGHDDVHTEENTPRISIVSPVPSGIVGDQTDIKAVVSARFKIREVDFYLDGALLFSDFQFPYEARVPLSSFSGDSHAVLVRAYDIYDNTGTDSVVVSR